MGTPASVAARLGRLLAARGVPVEPILSAVELTGIASVYLAVSATSSRIDVLVPFQADALAAICPELAAPLAPPRAMIRIAAEGAGLGAGLVLLGDFDAREAVDSLAAPDARDAWFRVVEQLRALPDCLMSNRTRSLTDEDRTIVVWYPQRSASDDVAFVEGIGRIASHVGIEPEVIAAWNRVHAALGPGAAVSISTRCGASGPEAALGLLYRSTEWDRAVEVATLVARPPAATGAASMLGTVAGIVANDRISAIEVVLTRAAAPDVVVWATIREIGQRGPDAEAYERVLREPGSLAARAGLLAVWKVAGDPRAELLEIQLELRERYARGDWSSDRSNFLHGRVGAITRAHGRAWAGEVADLVSSFTFHRGLVARVDLPGERFLAVAARLFELAPIQHVRLLAPLGDLEAIASSPWLRHLVSIDLSGHGAAVGDRCAIALAQSPQVIALRWLALDHDDVGAAGVEALAASPYLREVEYLSLTGNPSDTTPSVYSDDGRYWSDRPVLAGELEARHGQRPWMSARDPENWPPDRDELAVTP